MNARIILHPNASYCQYFSVFLMFLLLFQNVHFILQSVCFPYLLRKIILLHLLSAYAQKKRKILCVLSWSSSPSNHCSLSYVFEQVAVLENINFLTRLVLFQLSFSHSVAIFITLDWKSWVLTLPKPILGAKRARNLRNASLISKDVGDLTFWALTFKLVSSLIRTNISESK